MELPFLDVAGEAYRKDPTPIVNAARNRHWIAQGNDGFEVLAYEQCARLMRDPNVSPGITEIMTDMGATSPGPAQGRYLLTSEGEEHMMLRKAVAPWFSPQTVDRLRSRTGALAERLVDNMLVEGSCEFQRDVASKIPPAVFCWMVGADDSHAPQLAAWSDSVIKMFNADPADVPEIEAAGRELRQFAKVLVAEKRSAPGDDLVSFMLDASAHGSPIEDADVLSLTFEMLSASSDNVSHSASLMMWLFADNPDQWRTIQTDPSLIPNAVEESMRMAPRVRRGMKITTAEIEIDGVTFPPRSRIFFHVAAANRDPAVFENPDTFDVTRAMPKPQLVFGQGRHHCLGANLARMELGELLRVLAERCGPPRLNGKATFIYTDDMAVQAMPLAFEPR